MSAGEPDRPLNHISTLWTVVCQARGGPGQAATAAQQVLLHRYGGAVHRYLLGALRDAEAAEDLAQEFALRFLRGDFRGADRQRGRFRDFVRGVLSHLVADYHRRKRPLPLADEHEPAAPAAEAPDLGGKFAESWRDELLSRAWEALRQAQPQTGLTYYAVLRFRADHPEASSADMAQRLGARLGKPVTDDAVRKALQRAREKYTDLLLEEIVQTLEEPTADEVERELIDLELLERCRPALERFRRGG